MFFRDNAPIDLLRLINKWSDKKFETKINFVRGSWIVLYGRMWYGPVESCMVIYGLMVLYGQADY